MAKKLLVARVATGSRQCRKISGKWRWGGELEQQLIHYRAWEMSKSRRGAKRCEEKLQRDF